MRIAEKRAAQLDEVESRAAASGKVRDLERLWQSAWCHAQEDPSAALDAWGPREKGQARQLIQRFLDQAGGVEDPELRHQLRALAAAFIRAAVEHWTAMTTTVRRKAAIREAPADPSIGWVLRWFLDAWAWYETEGEP